jgi:hypothetical protein
MLKNVFKNFDKYTFGSAGLATLVLALAALSYGFTAIIKFLFPLFAALSIISCGIFLCLILPLSLIHRLRPQLSRTALILSLISGISVWMYSFLVIIGYLGWLALFLFFLFYSIVPFAALGLFLNGQVIQGLALCAGLAMTYLMRFYSFRLESKISKNTSNDNDFIDIEAKVL